MNPFVTARRRSNAEVLVWQSRLRILVASTAAVAEMLLLVGRSSDATAPALAVATVLLATVVYVLVAAGIATVAKRVGSAGDWMVAVTSAADVALIFGLTIPLSPPTYYNRVLILAFIALHFNTFYFGRRHGLLVLALAAAAYAWLIRAGMAAGSPLAWHQEMWSLGAFVLAAILLLVEHGSLRDRLETIVRLFGRAEEGDFTESYDESADLFPDAITRVGSAYNRVRGQLASLVLTDALTGCVNRRGFDQALVREVARAARAGSDLALLALDVDHFKSVNDTHGHPAGDAVLREVGMRLMHEARAGDVVARTGGEEFALILPDTSATGAYRLASRLCGALRDQRYAGASEVRLTVSIGVAATAPSVDRPTSETGEVLKGRADEALYAAKRGGRDRVRVWSADGDKVLV